MIRVGDEVVTKSPLWHNGTDVGDRLGRVISTESYIVVDIYDYNDNPVKCFRNDIEVIQKDGSPEDYVDQLDLFFGTGKP